MQTLLLVVHYFACIMLILLILLQSGKGSAAGIFGASGADNIFASPTAFNAVNKLTAALAIVLFLTSILLTVSYNHRSNTSLMDKVNIPTASAPVNR